MQYTDLYKPHGGKNPLIPEVGISLNLRTLWIKGVWVGLNVRIKEKNLLPCQESNPSP